MELTGAAASRTMEGDEESERLREESARGCSVRVERWVRQAGRMSTMAKMPRELVEAQPTRGPLEECRKGAFRKPIFAQSS